MELVTVVDHPLIQHNLTLLRDTRTALREFRRCLGEVSALMVYEATRSFETVPVEVTTPLTTTQGAKLRREVILVPVLRAGLGMLDGIIRLMPDARVGFIGLRRDETTLLPATYHESLPNDISDFELVVIDPMLATGGSAVAALDALTRRGGRHIRLINLVAAPAGIAAVRQKYPKIPIFTAAIDERLNDHGYIVPGLGDAGDRLFGV